MSSSKNYISNVRELRAFFEQEAKLKSNENLERGKAVEQQVLGSLRLEGIALHPQGSEAPQADEAHSTVAMSAPVKVDLPDERCGGCDFCIASRKFKEDTQRLSASLSGSSSSAATPAPPTPEPAATPAPEVKGPEHYVEGKTFSAGQFGSVPEPAQGSSGSSSNGGKEPNLEEEMGEKVGVFLKITKVVEEQDGVESIFESLFSKPSPPGDPREALVDALVDILNSRIGSSSSSDSASSSSSSGGSKSSPSSSSSSRSSEPLPFSGCAVKARPALIQVVMEEELNKLDRAHGTGSALAIGASGLQTEFDRLKKLVATNGSEWKDPCYSSGEADKSLHWILRYPLADPLPQGTPVCVIRRLTRTENTEHGITIEPYKKAYICAAQIKKDDHVTFFLAERKFLQQVSKAEFDRCVESKEAHALAEFLLDSDNVASSNMARGKVVRLRRGTSLARYFSLGIFRGCDGEQSCRNLSTGNPSRYSGDNVDLLLISKNGQGIERKVGRADICTFE